MEINRSKTTKVNYETGNGRTVKAIVIHYTGNYNDTAESNINYFHSVYRASSAHYFVDDNSIWQCVSDCDVAWSVGVNYGSNNLFGTYGNLNTLNIEMCSTNGKISDATMKNTAWLVRKLMSDYGIDINHVFRHYDICSKRCPGWSGWIDNATEWERLKRMISGDAYNVSLWDWKRADNQKWFFESAGNGKYYIKNKETGKYLDIKDKDEREGNNVICYEKNGGENQKFELELQTFTADGVLVIHTFSDMVIDNTEGRSINGNPVGSYIYNGGLNQKWAAVNMGDGSYGLINLGNGKCLDCNMV